MLCSLRAQNSLGDPLGLGLGVGVVAEGLDAAANGVGALGREAGEDGRAAAAPPQEAAERQRHSGPGDGRPALLPDPRNRRRAGVGLHRQLSALGDGGEGGGGRAPVALELPLRGGRAVDGHANGGGAGGAVGQGDEPWGGGQKLPGLLSLADACVHRQVWDRGSELTQLRDRAGTQQDTGQHRSPSVWTYTHYIYTLGHSFRTDIH